MKRLTAVASVVALAAWLPVASGGCGDGDSAPAPVAADAGADIAPVDAAPQLDALDAAAPVDLAIYAHSSTTLYRFDADALTLAAVGTFSCAADRMRDIAVNRNGQIFGATSQGLVQIDPKSAFCSPIASGVFPRALTFVPIGLLDPEREVLVGYSFAQYVRIDETTGAMVPIGALNPSKVNGDFLVSGDVVSGPNGHLFLTSLNGPSGDLLVEADPVTGKALKRIGTGLPSVSMLGLAQWKGSGYAFTASGKIYKISLKTGFSSLVTLAADAGAADASADGGAAVVYFAGAGVTTLAPLQ